MTDRATCWSLTINNPTEQDLKPTLPAKWTLQGQLEEGEEKGTEHFQGMLITPQVRFSAVKKIFPRAHIEVARNRQALEKYVHKADTRISEVATIKSDIPTLFDYQHTVADSWNDDDFREFGERALEENPRQSMDDIALSYVDHIVAADIERGVCGIEYIAINPMWRSAWKRFWRSLVRRERNKPADSQTDRQPDNPDEDSGPNVE